ncbi:MAG: transglycosylase SLT domain-containing protein [Pseudomonadales bacterium]|nr:transglycosylase SLT domain-containing protein [Pseudomonadales bacterium]
MKTTIATTILFLASSAYATTAKDVISADAWFSAMKHASIDSSLLYAIALRESGTSFNQTRPYRPYPWTMNIDHKAHFYDSKGEMIRALKAEVEAGNKNVAVGMYQIHLRYNSHLVNHPIELVDPETNLVTASEVLRDCGTRYKTTEGVLSCYYSGDLDAEGKDYALGVVELARKWGRPFDVGDSCVQYSVHEYETGLADGECGQLTQYQALMRSLRPSAHVNRRIVMVGAE